ncbi:MAG: hypothetical protein QM669_08870 [Siphonobacter sp.]
MKRVFGILLLFSCIQSLKAQTVRDFKNDSLQRAYNRETILLLNGGSRFAKERRVYSSGPRQIYLQKQFEFSPNGLDQFRQYRKFKTISTIMTVASVGTAVIGLTSTRKSNAYWAWWGAGIVIGLGNGVVSSMGNNHLQQALWIRNRDALTTAQ